MRLLPLFIKAEGLKVTTGDALQFLDELFLLIGPTERFGRLLRFGLLPSLDLGRRSSLQPFNETRQ